MNNTLHRVWREGADEAWDKDEGGKEGAREEASVTAA